MKTIKAKQTIAGYYGQLSSGETTTVTDRVASELEKAGLIEIVGEAGADTEESNDSSISITDNTAKEKKQIIVKDEKKSDAGPESQKTAPATETKSDKKDAKKK